MPLAPVIFAGRSDVGLIILPIMLFHFFQLLIVSFIAARAGRRPERACQGRLTAAVRTAEDRAPKARELLASGREAGCDTPDRNELMPPVV